jgi:hypothetical protein
MGARVHGPNPFGPGGRQHQTSKAEMRLLCGPLGVMFLSFRVSMF